MKFVVEIDGVVVDIAAAHFRAYRETATAVGWAAVDQATYWRLVRTKGREAPILPGATPLKVKDFYARFDARVEADEILGDTRPQAWAESAIGALRTFGTVSFVTLGSNVAARRLKLQEARLLQPTDQIGAVDADPRRRPAQLRALCSGDKRCMVVAATDALLRSSGDAELLGVGIACGNCAAPRLHAAGADVVYKELSGLVDSLKGGAEDLIRAGLLPASLG